MTDGSAVVFDVAWGGATDTGSRRMSNQDCFLAEPPVFVVADGMGGHERGELASQAVVSAFAGTSATTWLSANDLHGIIDRAVDVVRSLNDGRPGAPGSTVTGAAMTVQHGRPCWLIFNIGDSRVYRANRAGLEQITVDHSRVQELIEAGRLDPVAAPDHPDRNVITRAVGGGLRGTPTADLWLLIAETGDRLLICSDGLTREVSEDLLFAELSSSCEPQQVADRLIAAALVDGAKDNVTAVVVDAVTVVAASETSSTGRVDISDDTAPEPELWSDQPEPRLTATAGPVAFENDHFHG